MKLIYKQALNIYDPTEIFLPKGAKFLFVKSQSNAPMIWYEFDPDVKEKTRRVLRIQLTGRTFNDNQVYLGTFEVKTLGNLDDEESRSYTESVKMNEFIFVGHVYEEIIK